MKKWLVLLLFVVPYLTPPITYAHSFGKLYNLPVPFWLYLYGATGALLTSFLIIGVFSQKKHHSQKPVFFTLPSAFTTKTIFSALRVLSVFLLFFTIFTGIVGEDSSYSNFNMTFFWVIFVLGLSYTTIIIGDVYSVFNPWKVITEWIEKISPIKLTGVISYPMSLGYYPACILYFLFIWIELFGGTGPLLLSLILLQYTFINFIGIFLVGKDNWFRYGEFFSVFFRLIGKVSSFIYRLNTTKESISIALTRPFTQLSTSTPEHFSIVLFILFMLSSTAFDGMQETHIWQTLYTENFKNVVSLTVFDTFGLLLSPFIFLIMYVICIWIAKSMTKNNHSIRTLSLQFAFSLIPIAVVYNIAHYYTLIITEGQNFIRILSDPFGFGWNIFNTVGYIPQLTFIDTSITWHIQVGLILLGHIVSVYIAHVIALSVFSSRKNALISQLPMLLLMVSYTVIGLFILSQPITGGTQ